MRKPSLPLVGVVAVALVVGLWTAYGTHVGAGSAVLVVLVWGACRVFQG